MSARRSRTMLAGGLTARLAPSMTFASAAALLLISGGAWANTLTVRSEGDTTRAAGVDTSASARHRTRLESMIPVSPMPPSPTAPGLPGNDPVDAAIAQARGLLRIGRLPEGLQQLRDLYKSHPGDQRVFYALVGSLESANHNDEAATLYREAADHLKDPGPALIGLERVLRVQQQWPRVFQVCLEYLDRVGDRNGWVADEIESLVRTDKMGTAAVDALEEACRKRPADGRLPGLLVLALVHDGKIDRAIEKAAILDEARKAHGREVMAVALAADDAQNPAAALSAYDRVLQLDPTSPMKEDALYRRATALRKLGRLPECLAALDAAAAGTSPSSALRARFDQAAILDHEMNRPAEALKAYDAVLAQIGASPKPEGAHWRDQVRLAMADCQLRLQQASEANKLYQQVADEGAEPETKAAALFSAGEMLFYQGRLKEAEDTWYQVVDKYPGERWVNDALARILLLGEKTDQGGIPITALAQAEYQRRLGKFDLAFKLVDDALAQYPASRVNDDLMLERVSLLLDLGKLPEARAEADTLGQRYPQSLLAPRALMAVADQLVRAPATVKDGQALYLDVLTRFPDSLEAANARVTLQKMKESSSSQWPVWPEKAPEKAPEKRG